MGKISKLEICGGASNSGDKEQVRIEEAEAGQFRCGILSADVRHGSFQE
jgi:hypothetical protein